MTILIALSFIVDNVFLFFTFKLKPLRVFYYILFYIENHNNDYKSRSIQYDTSVPTGYHIV